MAIVKRGPEGMLAATQSQLIKIAPIRLPVVNGLGAGDALKRMLAHGLVRGWSLERTLAPANAAGAPGASRAEDFGPLAEIEAVPSSGQLSTASGGLHA